MQVKLLTYTPEPEKVVAAAARICYSNVQDVNELLNGLTEEKIDNFLQKMQELKQHGTPWEHPSFTFAIEGVSRALSHQLVRHRIASYDQQSQRYCDGKNFSYVIPSSIKKNPDLKEGFEKFMEATQKMYDIFIEEGIPKEDARFVFPHACSTRLIMTMNLRSLMHFFSLRCCSRAQWEIRELANKILGICKEISPKLFAKAGASCIQNGYCPEGNMTCGRAPTLKRLLDIWEEVRIK